jgi:hypothetical protein
MEWFDLSKRILELATTVITLMVAIIGLIELVLKRRARNLRRRLKRRLELHAPGEPAGAEAHRFTPPEQEAWERLVKDIGPERLDEFRRRTGEQGLRPIPEVESALDRIAGEEAARARRRYFSMLGGSAILVLAGAVVIWSNQRPYLTADTEVTMKAFNAFEREDWEGARTLAKKCVDEFSAAANETEKKLVAQKVPVPPTGKCTLAERDRVFDQQGVVNNVAASYWILGRVAAKLNQRDVAKSNFTKAASFSHAVFWDKRIPGFWSPAEDAAGRLEAMEEEDKHTPAPSTPTPTKTPSSVGTTGNP